MSDSSAVIPESPRDLPTVPETVQLVRRWVERARGSRADADAARLAALVRDPTGLAFVIAFVDHVVRPEDLRVAARGLERLSRHAPPSLPRLLRAALTLGGGFALILPRPIIPIARRVFRRMVGHLVLDATPARLQKSIASLRKPGVRLNLNLLGEAVLGEREASRRLGGVRELLARDDVDHVSVKVSSIASQLSMWGFESTVERVVERLTPLYEQAATASTRKFITLDMEEYRDLDLTIAVFTRLLAQPGLAGLEAGIVLQSYLPDALGALQELNAWARQRVAAGGAGIKVRVVKGANLAMERVDAALHGWPLATWPTKRETDTNYKRMLDWALTPARTDAMRIGVAGQNLFDLAFARLLAERRGVTGRIEVEMLIGMAPALTDAVRADTGGVLLYTPVVRPADFGSAMGYLVRRLEENAGAENFMTALFELDDEAVFEREATRFAESVAALDPGVPSPNRRQNRLRPGIPESPVPFRNEPDTDPALAANREWGRTILERARSSELGVAALAAAAVRDEAELRDRIAATASAGEAWGRIPAENRADLLHRAGEVLSVFRGRLVEVMVAETGKTLAEADTEVSEAVDFAHHYAARAHELVAVTDAVYVPVPLTVVVPPWNFPVSIPAGGILSALAAGSGVLLKPAPEARRCGAVLAEALWEAGIPREVLGLLDLPDGEAGRVLVTAPEVGRVLLTGSRETADLFRTWRPDLPLIAETSGKNAIVVTPGADPDLAVADLVQSAFGNAGQKCSAASLAILVGSMADSEAFRRRLADAASSVEVGWPTDAAARMGPLIAPPGEKLERGLTRLGVGESWLVQPRRLDGTDRLWSPGIRLGVRPGSEFHRTEYFGPVLGIMSAATLDEAIDLQNAVEYGLTAGLHSLDAAEIAAWLERVEAGNLYVNRATTGAIVRRQPFGGWKRSSVGPGAKAGGPNTLFALGSWQPVAERESGDLRLDGLDDRVRALIEASQGALDYEGFDRVRRGALSDEAAWRSEFGSSHDPSALGIERNVLRYRPAEVTVRLGDGGSLDELLRVVAAGVRARATMRISSPVPLPSGMLPLVSGALIRVAELTVEGDAPWLARTARELPARIRLVGGDHAALIAAVHGSTDVAIWAGPVTTAGRIEMLPFLREQAVSITAHRFGAADREIAALAI